MSNQYYKIYLSDTLKLTKSMVIKSEATANAINESLKLVDRNYVAPENKTLWKYYQNLNGDYFYMDINYLRDYNYKNNLKVNIRKNIILNALDAINLYVDLGDFAYAEEFIIKDQLDNLLILNVDYQYSFTGGADGKTRITFIGDYAFAGSKQVMPGDAIFFNYYANNGKLIIKSIDTLDYIEFTKENLLLEAATEDNLVHTATHDAYAPGSSYYDELVRRYPDQEILIRGVLKPIAIADSISAADNQILLYDESLVEENEISLIKKLQTWIDKYFIRWNVYAYSLVDELYIPAHLGIMWLSIPSLLLNFRLAACKTHEVHSYHIREYLASHNKLDEFFDYMTKAQQLFLYRNINYIQRNAGKISTFSNLLENILTKRGIPLNAWSLNHNVEQIGKKVYPDIVENDEIHFTSSSEMLFEPLNNLNSEIYDEPLSVYDVLLKENGIARSNPEYIDSANAYINWNFNNSQFSHLKTKALESSMIDYSEAQPYKFTDVVLNHWLYLSSTLNENEQERYNAAIPIIHPNTGDEIYLSSADAFILFLYAFNKSTGNTFEGEMKTLTTNDINLGFDLEVPVIEGTLEIHYKGLPLVELEDYTVEYLGGTGGVSKVFINSGSTLVAGNQLHIRYEYNGGLIPTIKACRVRRLTLPTVNQMMKPVDSSIVDLIYPTTIIANQPVIDTYASIEAFHAICVEIFQGVLKHRALHSFVEDKDLRAYVEQQVDMCYQDVDIDLGNGKTFFEWFDDRQLTIENLTREDWLNFSLDILNTATGAVFNKDKSLRKIQEAMIGIMSRLSSYSIQFLKLMVDNLIITDWISIRFSDSKTTFAAAEKIQVHIEDIDIEDNFKGYADYFLDLNIIGEDIDVNMHESENKSIDPTISISNNTLQKDKLLGYIPLVEFYNVDFTVIPLTINWSGVTLTPPAYDQGYPTATNDATMRILVPVNDGVTFTLPYQDMVYLYNGSSFIEQGSFGNRPPFGFISNMKMFNDIVYITGAYYVPAKYESGLWSALPDSGALGGLANGRIEIDSLGNVYINTFEELYKWDGSVWTVVHTFSNSNIKHILNDLDDMFIHVRDNISSNKFIYFDDGVSGLVDISPAPDTDISDVTFLTTFNNDLYIAAFDATNTYSRIMKWNGVSWNQIGDLYAEFPALAAYGVLAIYVDIKGVYISISDPSNGNVLKHNGSSWSIIGQLPGGNVNGFYRDSDGKLNIYGTFSTIDGQPANGIAKYLIVE